MKNIKHYAILAELFRYPSPKLKAAADNSIPVLDSYNAGIDNMLAPFSKFVSTSSLAAQQEYYTHTFDVQPVTTLDIGYVLFGDDYKRGIFMVYMKREHLKASNDCGSELPDHLPCILTLLSLMKDPMLAEELICSILIPAVEELIRRFKNRENHYSTLLQILLKVLTSDFPSTAYEKFQFTGKAFVRKHQ